MRMLNRIGLARIFRAGKRLFEGGGASVSGEKRRVSGVARAGLPLAISACLLIGTVLYTPSTGEEPEESAAPSSAAVGGSTYIGEPLSLRPFLPNELAFDETLGLWRTHTGEDIACVECTAMESGAVLSVSRDRIWGVCVEMETQNGRYVYRSLKSACVSVGENVSAGERIGLAGIAPCEAEMGEHVHVERYANGVPVAPFAPQ